MVEIKQVVNEQKSHRLQSQTTTMEYLNNIEQQTCNPVYMIKNSRVMPWNFRERQLKKIRIACVSQNTLICRHMGIAY